MRLDFLAQGPVPSVYTQLPQPSSLQRTSMLVDVDSVVPHAESSVDPASLPHRTSTTPVPSLEAVEGNLGATCSWASLPISAEVSVGMIFTKLY